MKKLKIPSAFEADKASDFFKSLLDMNSELKGFSQRSLSASLKWPVSYIPDLIKDRKPFTVARCLEFIETFGINLIDAEHLILLAVSSQSKIELKAIRSIKSPEPTRTKVDSVLFRFEVLLIFEVIRWFRGQATLDKIHTILSKPFLTREVVEETLQLLLDKNLIEKVSDNYRVIAEGIFSDEKLEKKYEILLHQHFAENLKLYRKSNTTVFRQYDFCAS